MHIPEKKLRTDFSFILENLARKSPEIKKKGIEKKDSYILKPVPIVPDAEFLVKSLTESNSKAGNIGNNEDYSYSAEANTAGIEEEYKRSISYSHSENQAEDSSNIGKESEKIEEIEKIIATAKKLISSKRYEESRKKLAELKKLFQGLDYGYRQRLKREIDKIIEDVKSMI